MHKITWPLLVALLLSGCLAPDGGNATDAPDPSPARGDDGVAANGNQTGNEATGTLSNGTRWDVVIENEQYHNGTLAIRVGDTVMWEHRDQSTEHTVTADDGAFDSGSDSPLFMNGFTYTHFAHTFETPGTYAYHCQVHPEMTGTITVLERQDETL